jgi:NodT family efflux transporter outer membrane factor (OMF) lipoprotein
MLGGCASMGTPPAPAAQRTAAQAGLADGVATTAVDAAWWHQFGDPTLDDLVAKALADSPGLKAAADRVVHAQALAEGASGKNGPQLGFEADVTRERVSENGLYPPPFAGSTIDIGNLQYTLSWSLDFWGKQKNAIQAALGAERAAEADAAVAAQALAVQVSRAYFQLARLGSQREVAVATLDQRQVQLSLVQQRVKAGLDTVVELRQAEGLIPDGRTQIEQIDEQIALTRHQLAVLSAQPPQALDTLAITLARLSPREQPTVLGADLLGRRPDVVAARERVEAAQHDVASAKAEFYPDIDITAFVGLNGIGLNKIFPPGSRQYGIGPAIRLPIFDGGQLRANLKGHSADYNAAVEAYNQQVLEAVREAVDANTSSASIARQRTQSAQALASAESAYDAATQRYKQGLTSLLVLLNTETQVLAQRRTAVDLQFRTLDVQAQLMKSLGGGWTNPVPPTATTQAAIAPRS